MSWRTGLDIFLEVLKVVDKYEMDADDRLEFKARLLQLFLDWDIDPDGLEDDPEIGPIYSKLEEIQEMD